MSSPSAETNTSPTEGSGEQNRTRGNQHYSGRGHQGRGNNGGRGRGREGRRDNRNRNNTNRRQTQRFRGATEEIEDYTFGIHEGHTGAKRYTDNLKQLKIYAYRHCTTDVGSLFRKNPKTPEVEKPTPLTELEKKDETEKELCKLALREYVEQSRKMKQEVKKLYGVILGQCTEAMVNKLKALEDFDDINDKADSAKLLLEIRKITYLTNDKEDPFMSAAKTSNKLHRLVQERESLTDYYSTWSNMAEVVKQKGGGFINDELIKVVLKEVGTLLGASIVKKIDESKYLEENEFKLYCKARKKAEDRFLGSLFIKGLSGDKYTKLKDELANQRTWGTNNYPADVTAAYEMALNYRSSGNGRNDRGRNTAGIDGLSFSQNNDGRGANNQQAMPGTDGRTWYNMVCYHCGQPGHRAAVCPEVSNGGGDGNGSTNGSGRNTGSSTQGQSGVSCYMIEDAPQQGDETDTDTGEEGEYGITFSQMVKRKKGVVDQNWILLDSQSTHSIFSNGSLLTNIRHCGHAGLTMYSNGGSQHTVLIGDYEPLGLTVWYNEQSLANILAMRDTRKVARLTMDSEVTPAIAAQKFGENGLIMIFEECEIGLYRHDVANIQTLKINDQNGGFSFINTVEGNKRGFTRREIERANIQTLKINDQNGGFSFINTVEGNKRGFTRREIERANQSMVLYRIIGRPSEQRYYAILQGNHIMNCPITVEDAKRAFYIYGPDVATIRGKMTRRTPNTIKDYIPFQLPPELLTAFRRIHLAADIFFVQGRAHHHTICRRIKVRTVERMKNMTKSEILRTLQKVITLYQTRGFNIAQIMTDNQYECIRDSLLPIQLTVVGAGEHVGDIERSIRTVKEAARTTTQGLPFQRYPGVLVDAIIKKAVSDRNSFPEENGVSKDISPRTIITGQPKVDFNDCKLEIGQYCEIHTHPDPTNKQHTRSVGAIALLPSNNNGGYTFMSLKTGEVLHSYIWRALPMSRDVIRMVNRLGKRENQPMITKGGLAFEWGVGQPILDDDDDPNDYDNDYDTDDNDEHDDDHHLTDDEYDMEDDLSIQDIDEDQRSETHHDHDEPNDPDADDNNNNDENEENEVDNEDDNDDDQPENNNDNQPEQDVHDVHDVTDNETDEEENITDHEYEEAQWSAGNGKTQEAEAQRSTSNEENNTEAQRSATNKENELDQRSDNNSEHEAYTDAQRSQMNREDRSANAQRSATTKRNEDETNEDGQTRTSKRRTARHNYKEANRRGFNFLNVTDPRKVDHVRMAKCVTGIVMTQLEPDNQQKKIYYWKKGVRVMGEDAIKAIVKEAKQLDDKETFKPMRSASLTKEQRKGALESIATVTKKRCGRVKGRTCADGRKQREYMSKAEASSPTVSLEGLMTIILTASHEDRQVMVADIAGAYLNADMDDFVIMKFKDEMVDYMVEANPERYREYVEYENGRKVLYVRLLKVLYGCIHSALLWYKVFTGKLVQMGYKLNQYDQCIANKMEKGKQCTIGYYVDDLIATHVDKEVLAKLKDDLEEEYGEMSVTFGDKQTYLGMDIKFNREKKQAAISMQGYIEEAIEKFEEVEKLGTKPTNTPAKRDLFEVNEKANQLDEQRRALFHSVTALLLYVSKRARPDISTTIAFLCTRPTVADEDDWRKLRRLLQYLRTTLEMELIIGADAITAFKTFIDVAYGVHMDMKSHTGGAITFGTGVVSSKSSKQKLNIKSSTEGEVVGMSNYVAFPIWFRYFLEEQGYEISENIVYQDNQSAMKIEKNGIQSCGKKSRHINSRYFFIKDRVEKNEIKVEYCPTEKMMADFFTKPLQGELFRRFRDVIMGHKHISTLLNAIYPKNSSKERVGQNDNPDTTGTAGRDTSNGNSTNDERRVSYADVVRGKVENEINKGNDDLILLR